MFEPTFSLERARSVLGADRVIAMLRAMKKALDHYNGLSPEVTIAFDPSLTAHFLNRQWYQSAKQEMADMGGVTFDDHNSQWFVRFDQEAIVRHKKFDGQLRSRNFPALHNRRWLTPQLSFEEIPDVGRLQFGYRLDATERVMKDAFITLPAKGSNLWVWQIWGEPIETFGIPLPLRSKPVRADEIYWYDDFSQVV
jgi:hypothetical protein